MYVAVNVKVEFALIHELIIWVMSESHSKVSKWDIERFDQLKANGAVEATWSLVVVAPDEVFFCQVASYLEIQSVLVFQVQDHRDEEWFCYYLWFPANGKSSAHPA